MKLETATLSASIRAYLIGTTSRPISSITSLVRTSDDWRIVFEEIIRSLPADNAPPSEMPRAMRQAATLMRALDCDETTPQSVGQVTWTSTIDLPAVPSLARFIREINSRLGVWTFRPDLYGVGLLEGETIPNWLASNRNVGCKGLQFSLPPRLVPLAGTVDGAPIAITRPLVGTVIDDAAIARFHDLGACWRGIAQFLDDDGISYIQEDGVCETCGAGSEDNAYIELTHTCKLTADQIQQIKRAGYGEELERALDFDRDAASYQAYLAEPSEIPDWTPDEETGPKLSNLESATVDWEAIRDTIDLDGVNAEDWLEFYGAIAELCSQYANAGQLPPVHAQIRLRSSPHVYHWDPEHGTIDTVLDGLRIRRWLNKDRIAASRLPLSSKEPETLLLDADLVGSAWVALLSGGSRSKTDMPAIEAILSSRLSEVLV